MQEKRAGKTVEGACYCGFVTFEIRLPARFCCHCHCSNCRRAHGAAFVTWAGFAEEQVLITSGRDDLTRYLTDTGATRSFCRRCGSTLFYEGPRWSGEIHVALSNINGEIDKVPGSHVFVDHHAPWWDIIDTLPQYGGESGIEPKDKG
jgi:hypothetical protein